MEDACQSWEGCLLRLLGIMHQVLLRTWSNSLTNYPPMTRVLSLQSALSTILCVAFESYALFPYAQANGGGSNRNKVVGISPRMYRHARGADIHPQTSAKLTSPKHLVKE